MHESDLMICLEHLKSDECCCEQELDVLLAVAGQLQATEGVDSSGEYGGVGAGHQR